MYLGGIIRGDKTIWCTALSSLLPSWQVGYRLVGSRAEDTYWTLSIIYHPRGSDLTTRIRLACPAPHTDQPEIRLTRNARFFHHCVYFLFTEKLKTFILKHLSKQMAF